MKLFKKSSFLVEYMTSLNYQDNPILIYKQEEKEKKKNKILTVCIVLRDQGILHLQIIIYF